MYIYRREAKDTKRVIHKQHDSTDMGNKSSVYRMAPATGGDVQLLTYVARDEEEHGRNNENDLHLLIDNRRPYRAANHIVNAPVVGLSYRVIDVEEYVDHQNNHHNNQQNNQHINRPIEPTPAVPLPTRNYSPEIQGGVSENYTTILRKIFPDCPPDYIKKLVIGEIGIERNESVVERVATKLLDKGYVRSTVQQHPALTPEVLQEFLEEYPDPRKVFFNTESTVSENYKVHAIEWLAFCLPRIPHSVLESRLDKYNGHFAPTVTSFKAAIISKILNFEIKEPMPRIPDRRFYEELVYLKYESYITAVVEGRHKLRSLKLDVARLRDELVECPCCYDDELLTEDILPCPDGHPFCRTCVQKSTEELMGQAKYEFPCLDADCGKPMPMSVIKQVLRPRMFSTLQRKLQEEEIRMANIPDLVQCPWCSFACIMPDPSYTVFKCMNPECMKESCRLCSKPNHLPLPCRYAENKEETDMRTFLENKMSEAMIRVCPKCKKRFYKEEGCNKMVCSCGKAICYVCRKPISGYTHFSNNGCPQNSDVTALHKHEVTTAGYSAQKDYVKRHPQMKGVALKYNPLHTLYKS